MNIYELDTPALVINLDVLERNLRNMAQHCAELGIALRAHTKSHKTPEIAKMQLASGAQGIVCQKLGDAEVMARAGIDDILITYNIVGKPKLRRLTELARWAKMRVTVDSLEVAEGISAQAKEDRVNIEVLVELDTGGQRTGVQSPQAALELGRRIMDLPGLTLMGLMTYPSHLRAKPFIQETVTLFQNAGLPCPVISGGGTGNEAISKEIGCTETRSGSYVYEGMTRVRDHRDLSPERCPVRVIVTVVSVPTPNRIIVDGGMKTFVAFPPNPYGMIIEYPEARMYAMSVEHGHIDVSQCSHRFRVGEKLSVIPNHAESVTNMHEVMFAMRNNEVEEVWQIRGRGKVQ
jgi:D-serine deaminase-like pyridoxal phosphate-dependent protein